MPNTSKINPAEKKVILAAALIQFVNVLEFMIIMPLGPSFSEDLGFALHHVGWVASSYMIAAAVCGVIGALFLDAVSRTKALIVTCLGLGVSTFVASFSQSLEFLIFARVLAGFFGGPTSSLTQALVSDVVPPERRGYAMGIVLSSFSIASILGVPLGLQLAIWGGWRMSFYFVSVLCFILVAILWNLLSFDKPPQEFKSWSLKIAAMELFAILRKSRVRRSLMLTFVVMFAGFLIIPNIAGFLQYNLKFPPHYLGLLYMVGGAVSFVTMRYVGRVIDIYGSYKAGIVSAFLLSILMTIGFAFPQSWLPVWVIFTGFMFCLSIRNVAYNTLTSKIPLPSERGRFQSFQSTIQHLASASGASLASMILVENANKELLGMPIVVGISIFATLLSPLLMRIIQKDLASTN